MKESEAWLRVARRVDAERLGICEALQWWRIPGGDEVLSGKMVDNLYKVFSPFEPLGAWWWAPPKIGEDTPRVLAALFLREMALDEEKARAKQR